jgi:hypothetical protein
VVGRRLQVHPYFGKREEIFEFLLGLEILIVEDKMKWNDKRETDGGHNLGPD